MQPQATKEWKDQSVDEKLELLRRTILDQRGQIQQISRRIAQLEQENYRVRRHSHSADGKIVVPLDEPHMGAGLMTSSLNSVLGQDPLA